MVVSIHYLKLSMYCELFNSILITTVQYCKVWYLLFYTFYWIYHLWFLLYNFYLSYTHDPFCYEAKQNIILNYSKRPMQPQQTACLILPKLLWHVGPNENSEMVAWEASCYSAMRLTSLGLFEAHKRFGCSGRKNFMTHLWLWF